MTTEPKTLQEAIINFSNPENCFKYLVSRRWPDGAVTCPTCGSKEVRFLATRRLWECKTNHPRRQFSVKVGTIFEDSPLGLDKWLPTIWMLANSKNGVSSYEIHRSIGVTQKTAWFMLHRIRLAMQTNTLHKMSGEIEVDETFIGGKARFMHKDRRARKIKGTGGMGKTAVMGLLERHGPDGHSTVKVQSVPTVRRKALLPEVREHVALGAEVFTDALPSYRGLEAEYTHKVIDHAETYAEGKVHTNGIENFWSLLKRGINGTYISVEPFHLFRYLDEQAYRFNNRKKMDDAARFSILVSQIHGKRVAYQQLTGKTGNADRMI